MSYTFKGALSARVDVGVHEEKKWCNDGGLDWSDSSGIGDTKFNSEYILQYFKNLISPPPLGLLYKHGGGKDDLSPV